MTGLEPEILGSEHNFLTTKLYAFRVGSFVESIHEMFIKGYETSSKTKTKEERRNRKPMAEQRLS